MTYTSHSTRPQTFGQTSIERKFLNPKSATNARTALRKITATKTTLPMCLNHLRHTGKRIIQVNCSLVVPVVVLVRFLVVILVGILVCCYFRSPWCCSMITVVVT